MNEVNKQQQPEPLTMVVIPKSEYTRQTELMQGIKDKLDKLDFSQVLTPKEYIGVKEACLSYSMARSYFEKLKRQGVIKTYKFKGKVYVNRLELSEVFKNSLQ